MRQLTISWVSGRAEGLPEWAEPESKWAEPESKAAMYWLRSSCTRRVGRSGGEGLGGGGSEEGRGGQASSCYTH